MRYPDSEILRRMSKENVAIVRAIYAAWEQGDFSSVDWADPEIEYTMPGPDARLYHGIEDMSRAWADWLRAWKDYSLVPHEFVDAGDKVVVIQTLRGKGRSSGVPIDDLPAAAILTLGNDGKVTRFEGYASPEDALKAAGVSR